MEIKVGMGEQDFLMVRFGNRPKSSKERTMMYTVIAAKSHVALAEGRDYERSPAVYASLSSARRDPLWQDGSRWRAVVETESKYGEQYYLSNNQRILHDLRNPDELAVTASQQACFAAWERMRRLDLT